MIEPLENRRLMTADFAFAGAIGGGGDDNAGDVATDASGNVYVTGVFVGTADFDISAAKVTRTSAGGKDAYIAKYNPAGKLLWVKTIGGGGEDDGLSVAVDAGGNPLVGGFFNGSVDFDPGTGVVLRTSTGLSDGFVLKLSASGTFLWVQQFAGGGDAGITEVDFDGTGNAYALGMFTGSLDLDPSAAVRTASSRGALDVCLVKLSSSGSFLYGKSFGGAGIDYANGLAVSSSQVSVAGSFYGSVDFDPGAGVTTLTSAGGSDVYVSQFDGGGNFIRARSIGGGGTDVCGDITTDGNGGVVLVGGFSGTADFDPSAASAKLTSAGDMDAFVLRLNASGGIAWAKRIGGAGKDRATDITRDALGNLFLTGHFAGGVDSDPGAGVMKLSSVSGSQDAFAMKLSSAGAFGWARRFGGASNVDIAEGVALGSGNSLFTVGRFAGSADFDPNTASGLVIAAGSGTVDGWLSKLLNR